MPLTVHRSASSSNMRSTHRSTSISGSYPYPYAYLYTYDALLNNSLGMSSSSSSAPSSSRRRRLRALGTLGLSDDHDGGRRRRMRRGLSSGSLLTNTYTSTSTRLHPRRVASEGSAASRQVLAEIEWWRVVQGQRDPDADFNLDVEQDAEDVEDNPDIDSGFDMEDIPDNEEDGVPAYLPSIPPVTHTRSHAHAHDDFTLPHAFSAHSRTSSSSSSDSELEMPHRVPRGAMPFPSFPPSGFNLNSSTIGASIFPPTPVSLTEYEQNDMNTAELNETELAPVSGPSAVVKAALAALFPSSPTSPSESTPPPPPQLLGFSLSIPFAQQDTSDVGIYTPALPQTSRVRAISLPETSNIGSSGMAAKAKHSRSPAECHDVVIGGALGNL